MMDDLSLECNYNTEIDFWNRFFRDFFFVNRFLQIKLFREISTHRINIASTYFPSNLIHSNEEKWKQE